MIAKQKLKICVYAISKNESKFVERWVDSMSEADDIYVLDTGSTDNTVELLKKRHVHVVSKVIEPWRFDVARNESLKLVPNNCDVCVCTDLDEVFLPGWRNAIEKIWKDNVNRIGYTLNATIDKNNNPTNSFQINKIHSRSGFIWTHKVHEILECIDEENMIVTDEIILNHYPDNSKSRASYLKLLESAVEENPNDDRDVHYLGREYLFRGKYNKCIDTLIKHVYMKNSVWKEERSASMRFIAEAYIELKRYDEARMWLDKAIKETPYLRDPYIVRANLEWITGNYQDIIYYCNEALKIKKNEKLYIPDDRSWDGTVYDLLSLGYFYTDNFDASLINVNEALKFKPDDYRLLENKTLIVQNINDKNN